MNRIKAFLFGESQTAEALDGISEDLAELFEGADDLKVNKAPLAAALKSAGITAALSDGNGEPTLNLDSDEDYDSVLTALQGAETLAKLAELGWVAVGSGDRRVSFIEIATASDSNGDPSDGSSNFSKADTYDAIVKGAIEFATSPDYDLPKADEDPGFSPGKISLGKQKDGKIAKSESVSDDTDIDGVLRKMVSEARLKSKLTPDIGSRGSKMRGKMRKAMNRHHQQ